MEIKGPRPVKAYAYRLAVEDFEMYAEQYHVQVLNSYWQTRSKHTWSAKSYIWPLNDTTMCGGPKVGIVTRRPMPSYDEFVWLHMRNSERFIANLGYQQICQYLENLVRASESRDALPAGTLEPSVAVHAPASHPPPMHADLVPVKPLSTRPHIRRNGHTTADDLLKSVLAKSKTLPSEATESPVYAGADRQSVCHREIIESREGRDSTIQHGRPANQYVGPHDSYIVCPPGSKMHMSSSSNIQLRGGRNGRSLADTRPTNRHRIPSAISVDPAVVEAVPYAMLLACTREVTHSLQPHLRSELGLYDANLYINAGVTGTSSRKSGGQPIRKPTLCHLHEKEVTKRMEVNALGPNNITEVDSPHYIPFDPSKLQRTPSSPVPRSPTREIENHIGKNLSGHVSAMLSSEDRISIKAQRLNTMQREHQKTRETSAAKKPGSHGPQVGPHGSRLTQYEDRTAEKSKLEKRYYRRAHFQCSPRPEDLPLPRFSLAQLKLVSKLS